MVSHDGALLDRIGERVTELAAERPTVSAAALALVIAPGLELSLSLSDAFAPEHLELAYTGADAAAARGRIAGCVFVGAGGATAFGDYAAGSNHVLPTTGAARFGGPLGPGAFMRRTSVVSVPSSAARELGPHVCRGRGRGGLSGSRRVGESEGEAMSSETRTATVERQTSETRVSVELSLDGGDISVATGVGFLDHMLDLLGRHGRLGLSVEASGDLETGAHHTVEDVGIALGQALDRALGDRSGIRRYGYTAVPMDEALGDVRDRHLGPSAAAGSRPICRRSRSPASTPS